MKEVNQFSRTETLIGKEGREKLKKSKVAVFGIGGVGSFVVEGLARAGIENLIIVDFDKYDITNINRQLGALHSTIGKYKVDVMKERILDINPNAEVEIFKEFFGPNSNKNIIDQSIDYIVDAVDNVTAKIELVVKANEFEIPIISAMGTGNKLDPTKFEITDIYKTSVCPLAKVIRKELRKRDIKKLKVLYSKEDPIKQSKEEKTKDEKNSPASISFVPSVAGLIIAGEVVKDIIKIK